MIKNLVFDFGKVLVDYSFEQLYDEYFPDRKSVDEFMQTVFSPYWGQQVDREVIPLSEIVAQLQQLYPHYAEQIGIYDTRHQDFVLGEVPGMKSLLTDLKAQGYRLYGLTNWCHKVHITMQQYGIFRLLDGWVISSEEHLVKPEPAIYQRLFDKFALRPEECIFTDDKIENVEGSLQVGMDAILFVNTQQYAQELQRRIYRQTSQNLPQN